MEDYFNIEVESRIFSHCNSKITCEINRSFAYRANTIVSTKTQSESYLTCNFGTHEIYNLSIGINGILFVINKEIINFRGKFNISAGFGRVVREQHIITLFTDIHKFMRHRSTILKNESTDSYITSTGISIIYRRRCSTGRTLNRDTAIIRIVIRAVIRPVSGVKHHVSNEHTFAGNAISIKTDTLTVFNHKILFRIWRLANEVMRSYRMNQSGICSYKRFEDMVSISKLSRNEPTEVKTFERRVSRRSTTGIIIRTLVHNIPRTRSVVI